MKSDAKVDSGSNYTNDVSLFAYPSMQLTKSRPNFHNYSTICYDSGFNNNKSNDSSSNNSTNNNRKFDITTKMLKINASKLNNNIANVPKQLNKFFLSKI
ncbi:unnamed protein product [Brugia pahangi]|uniref:Homeobox protein 2-like n=1 Tax=Brugia pahangi TaxID=6280 RepID=A0A0N4TWK7_BRUPA|nr:unnamed protein product [Brugia pahangi]